MNNPPWKQKKKTVMGMKVSANSKHRNQVSSTSTELCTVLNTKDIHPTIISSFSRIYSISEKADSIVHSCNRESNPSRKTTANIMTITAIEPCKTTIFVNAPKIDAVCSDAAVPVQSVIFKLLIGFFYSDNSKIGW